MQLLNPHGVAPIVKGAGQALQVHEIFPTVQGEGPFAGRRAVFVRLAGCNLRCWWCDTEWDDARDPTIDVGELLGQTLDCWHTMTTGPIELVVITGGEPLRQPLASFIARLLMFDALRVQIETAGTLWQSCLDHERVSIVVSPKTPLVNVNIAAHAYAYKYVVRSADRFTPEGIPITITQADSKRAIALAPPPKHLHRSRVYMQPCDEQDATANAKNLTAVAQLAMRHGYVASVQLHKLLDLP